MRKFMFAVVAFGITTGLALAQTPVLQKPAGQNPAVQPSAAGAKLQQPTWGKITNVNGNMFTWQQYDPIAKTFQGTPKQITIDPTNTNLKFYQYGENKYSVLQGGLKAQPFSNIGKDGVYAGMGMNGTNPSQIFVYPNQTGFEQGMKSFPTTGAIPGIPSPGTNPNPGSGK